MAPSAEWDGVERSTCPPLQKAQGWATLGLLLVSNETRKVGPKGSATRDQPRFLKKRIAR